MLRYTECRNRIYTRTPAKVNRFRQTGTSGWEKEEEEKIKKRRRSDREISSCAGHVFICCVQWIG